MNALLVKNLRKEYEKFTLEDVSFGLNQGEIMGFIGRNGAGKTTTLKCLLNYVHPNQGEIQFFGKTFRDHEQEIKQRIGFVSGGVDYYTKKKIRTITEVTRRFYTNWNEDAYRGYMQRLDLDENKTPSALSAGMKVKYSLALALSHHAELLILDEPTSGLDPISRDDLLDVFLGLASEGVTILFSTHITSDLEKCADTITHIMKGRIVASEPLESYVARYRLLHLTDEQLTETLKPALMGLNRAKHGYTALVRADESDRLGLMAEPANLETIMIHLERE
ncbi:MAG: ABC transporter ATP-binding protein [Clostridiales bacterium]|nr:ABC transporter ATP-binding protein [Clostridiales bacterium]